MLLKKNYDVNKRTIRSGMLIGVGLMASVDEIIFHQLLAWHHFYDAKTSDIGLFTDGLLHAGEIFALVFGFFNLLILTKYTTLNTRLLTSSICLGAGIFQLFDGLILHKILRLHQVRYVENLLPYDIAWNSFGLLLLAIGYYHWRKSKISS